MALEYRQTTDPCGIEVLDSIAQVSIHASTSNSEFRSGPTNVPFQDFIDETIELETWYIELSTDLLLYVFDEDMELLRRRIGKEQFSLPFDTYVITFPTPLKIYLLFTGAPEIKGGNGETRIELDEARPVVLGFRSNHTEPNTTVRTTNRPEDLARAISALGGSFSTNSPNRTWSGLRDHPPRLELGSELSIPDGIERPTTDIDILVPPRYGALFTAAPLTHYLSARLRTGDRPAILAGDERLDLGVDQPLEDDLIQVQRQMFFLDCVVRSIGLYKHDPILDEATLSRLPFDLEWAYDATLADRLNAYLSVEYTDIEPHMPRIPMVAHLPARPESVRVLPHVLHRLGVVRPARASPTSPESSTISAFTRGTGSRDSPTVGATTSQTEPHVELSPPDDAITQAWFGPGIPTNASKATWTSLEHGSGTGLEKDSIEVAVVCNDESMLPEHDLLDELYHKDLGIDRHISCFSDLSRGELAGLLTDEQYDLLHFVGHATRGGLHCRDGVLDAGRLSSVGLDLFVLNACETYHQAKALVDGGAVAGVATHTRVTNRDATTIGRNVSRLLSEGFSMSAAVEQATMHLDSQSQYLVVGDGLARYSTRENVTPTVLTVNLCDEDEAALSVQTYLWETNKLASVSVNYVYDEAGTEIEWSESMLDPGETSAYTLERDRLPEVVMDFGDSEAGPPLRFDGQLHWPDSETDIERLLERHRDH
ncbi:CHAT domain-containing protein [Haloarchaeobius sp. HME9146]|uniref:CHAT domain-containing protein n=1 Tax=Haloarchaeobius sp. HME9146 TaxID=2978732 RepID=UPI0021BEBC31|nr:CHAT domain-containing protein [Haloarchaeobius sp. HME9146]MCT9097212.1 CHAT domain-containing protein [Haloarchaeobius sp. HME9146]